MESELADEVPSLHDTTKNDANKYDDDEEQLDPVPKTSAGQARHFYYETDEANMTVKSRDYDDLYEHGHTYDLADMAKSAVRRSNGELVDKDELTFGSRPPTAPEKKRKAEDQEGLQTPSAQVSPTLHAFPSSQGRALGMWMQPSGPQLSSVQGLPSSQLRVSVPAHTPSWHRSPTVHASPSSHTATRFSV